MKNIIGMIHLSGDTTTSKIDTALKEIEMYEKYGLSGAIIENYHGNIAHVISCLEQVKQLKPKIPLGVNILPNSYELAFQLAERNQLQFIQLDFVSGRYIHRHLISSINSRDYQKERKKYPHIKVYGGVWPKYYKPVNNSNLETDLLKGITNCDAIVVTGHRTGRETPLEKILKFREIIGDKELIIGAGLTKYNAREQLAIANGAIVGSYFKNGNTTSSLDEDRINEIMEIAKEYK